jgi:sulfur carrier protein
LNGEAKNVANGQSVRQLLLALQIEPERVAVEVNRSIVRQTDWDSTVVLSGSHVEVVQFVGGG